jgi:hypothetical protein
MTGLRMDRFTGVLEKATVRRVLYGKLQCEIGKNDIGAGAGEWGLVEC